MDMNVLSNTMNFTDMMEENPNIKPLVDLIETIMDLSDDQLNETSADVVSGMIMGSFTENVREQAVQEIVNNFREMGYTKNEVSSVVEILKNEFSNLIDELKPTQYKRMLLERVLGAFNEIFEEARARFGIYDIELPIMLEEGAQMPVYAHNTDACADLFLAEDTTIPAHTMSTTLRTGVHIALPEGWLALIFPRSSIGSKTALRLSNSVGVIDEEYRGALGVLYDNVSDSDVTFKQGDRIAQMLVMPSYKFKGKQVNELPPSSRGEGGFGSTGK